MTVIAQHHIRKMRGGAQAQLLLADDSNFYIVKFQNNPQHLRVLANEMFATLLAKFIGLSVPPCEIVEVSDWLIEATPDLTMDLGPIKVPCRAGLSFGSRLMGGLLPGNLFDFLPDKHLAGVINIEEFAGILAFDKWTCNADGRQVVYSPATPKRQQYKATFIDFGYCFNVGQWNFQDASLRGVFARNLVYEGVLGWESFEPWLSRLEKLELQEIWKAAKRIPSEWYEDDVFGLESLVEMLGRRRKGVRGLIDDFRKSLRQPFPNWNLRLALRP